MEFLRTRWATISLVGLLTVFSVHLFDRWLTDVRVDLTQDDLYSLTEGSKSLLARMSDEGVKPVDVTLYFSETTGKTLPKFIKDFIGYERYLRSLLREYERASDGRVRVGFVDPIPDTDEAQDAADAGLEGKMINQEGDQFFFGLELETQTGSREVIPFLWPNEQENVEYEITKALSRLVWSERKRVGVLSSLEVSGSGDDPYMAQMLAAQGRQPTPKWIAVQLLDELYETSKVEANATEISPDDYDVLVVIHPKNLPQKTLFAIDQFVARGGRLLAFVDPYALDDQAPQNPQQPWMALQYQPASDLSPLLEHWGLARPANEFVADFELAVRRPLGNGGAETLLVDLDISGDDAKAALAADSPVVQGLSNLRFLLAGALEPVAPEGENGSSEASDVERYPLVTTTASGSTLTVTPGIGGQGDGLAYTDFNNPAALRDAFEPGTEPVAMAYVVRGKLGTAFPQGVEYPAQEPERPPGLPPGIELPPPEGTEMVRAEPLDASEVADSAVVVFADVDFISDQIAFIRNPFGLVQAANDNHRVFLNAVDYLLGSEELMSVRSKRPVRRPFELFDDIEAQAEQDTLEREEQIRAEIENFEQELRDKQSAITTRNASLFQKQVQDEVADLNERITEAQNELREIRKDRRARLEREESSVRFAVLGWMPLVILALGCWRAFRRRSDRRESSFTTQAARGAEKQSGGQA